MNIDVVIPTFNRFWSIQKVVPSYLVNPEVHNVIVVDDGSTDDTSEWLRKIKIDNPKLIVIRHEENRGACAARNSGAAIAKAPYVFFADDDMLLAPKDGLKILLDDLINIDADIIAPVLIFLEGIQPEVSIKTQKQPSDLLFLYHKILLERKPMKTILNIIPGVSFKSAQLPGLMFMRRSVLDKVKYDEFLGENSYRDETDFQLKAIDQGFHLYACPKVYLISLFNKNDDGGCHTISTVKYEFLCCRNNWRILKRHQHVLGKIGMKTPIQIMQFLFIVEHILYRLPRKIFYKFRIRMGLVRQINTP